MSPKTGLYICLLYFMIFSSLFTFIVPAFEAPDEVGHISYINFLQKHKTLPDQAVDSLKEPLQGHQPPLYYLALYSINYAFNSDKPIEYKLALNPLHVWNGGKNQHVPYYMHIDNAGSPGNFFHVFRLISVLLGMLNIVFIYKIALIVLKDKQAALLPVIFAATLPQFAFISGVINNDNPVNLFSTMSIYYLLKMLNEPGNVRNYILTGLSIGLGIITKKTIYFIFPVTAFVIVLNLLANSPAERKRAARGTFFAAASALLISSLYLYHNIASYGEVVGLKEEFSTFGKFDSHSLFSYYFIYPFSQEFFKSFVGYPGLMNVLLPKIFYLFYAVLFGAGFLSVVIRFKKILKERQGSIVLFLAIAACMAGIIYFNTLLSQFQGRFLFPVISAVFVSVSIGLIEFAGIFRRPGFKKYLAPALIAALIIFDIMSVIVTYKFYFTPSQYGM